MENYSKDNSNGSENGAKVRGYLRTLKQHKLVSTKLVKSVYCSNGRMLVSCAVLKLQRVETAMRSMIDN